MNYLKCEIVAICDGKPLKIPEDKRIFFSYPPPEGFLEGLYTALNFQYKDVEVLIKATD